MSLAHLEALQPAAPGGPVTYRSPGAEVWRRVRTSPSGVAGLVIVGLFVLVALLAPLLAPYDPAAGDLTDVRPGRVPGPSVDHPLGLDEQGRDELSRVLYGARHSLVVGVASVALGTLLGVALGAVAAGVGGWLDSLLMRLVDVLLAVPALFLAIAVAAVLGPGLPSVAIAIGVTSAPLVARLLRATMASQLESGYVAAATATGVPRRRIVLRHVLPNSTGPVIVGASLGMGLAILEAAGLSFLGLGGDPSSPEWGRMLAATQRSLQTAPQLALFPGAAIVLVVVGFNLVGEALREALDPKARRASP
ncbi:MAG: ABC transporter permease [Actinomycetota bacterium]|nr:ABC transporter permease [Actinomycetota bacterium]